MNSAPSDGLRVLAVDDVGPALDELRRLLRDSPGSPRSRRPMTH